MKATKIIYWVSTSIISVMMLFSAYSYITNPQMKAGFGHLGFPDYFRIELAIAKIFGALVLILPFFSGRVKEWAYAGFAFTFTSAIIAHISSGDPVAMPIAVAVVFAILIVSYISYHRMTNQADRVLHSNI